MARRRLPPLNALKAFEAAARRRSVTRAAEELRVTHGAVSHQIRTLEEYIGTPLLERSGNRFTLTAAGEQLLTPLSNGFDMLLGGLVSLDATAIGGEVTLSVPPALTCLWFVKAMSSLLALYPDLRIHLRPSNSPKEVIASDVDLCIRYGDGVWPGRRSDLLAEAILAPVCSPQLLRDGRLESLAQAPLLCGANPSDWDLWLAALQSKNLLNGARHHLGNDLVMTEAAIAGVGIAMGCNVTTRGHLEAGTLIRPFSHSAKSPSSFFLIDAGAHQRRAVVVRVREWILDNFAKSQTSAWPAAAGPAGRKRTPNRRR
jgi:LysR family transcriptional regulator, glycine cleavage system transcriptional activator